MITLAWDEETGLFRSGCMAPELVCSTWASEENSGILHRGDVRGWAEKILRNPEIRIVGQYFAYDAAVFCQTFLDLTPLMFAAYDANRVTDTKVRMTLIDIAQGTYRGRHAADGKYIKYGYSLDDIARRLLKVTLRKDGYRTNYISFIDVPLEQWPARALELQAEAKEMLEAFHLTGRTEKSLSKAGKAFLRELEALVSDSPMRCLEYPIDDAVYTLKVHDVQEAAPKEWLVDQFHQARGDFALHLSSTWGLRTDGAAVAALRGKTEAALVDVTKRLQEAGFVRLDGSRDTKLVTRHMLMVCERNGLRVRRTEKDGVCLDSDACEATEDPLLIDYAAYTGLQKTLDADIPMLEAGTRQPVHTRYGLAESGRTTSSGPNIQNFSRGGGVRECFVPRDGCVFLQADFPSLELFTLAQSCHVFVGYSRLGDALNAGIDPHTALAAEILGIPYGEAISRREAQDEVVDNARQTAKVANFGLPGGLGPGRLVHFAHSSYGVELTEAQAKKLKQQWQARWPEMKDYFAYISKLCKGEGKTGTVVGPFTKRVRGGCTYTAACNSAFQGLGADCAKRAMWLVARAQYAEPSSVLYGTRTVAFVHDELILEAKEGPTNHEAAFELARLMSVAANEYLPNVPIPAERIEPQIMRRWSKKAKQVWKNNRLVPWEGKAV